MSDDDDDLEEEPSSFSIEVGRRLRAIRRARQMSLEEVQRQSGGRWSASAIGAYERGFRNLSLPRLRELADFYSVPMGVLLGERGPLPSVPREPKVILDLEALSKAEDGDIVWRYVQSIILDRGDFNGRVLSIRRDDVRALAAMTQTTEPELFDLLRRWGALIGGRPFGAPEEEDDGPGADVDAGASDEDASSDGVHDDHEHIGSSGGSDASSTSEASDRSAPRSAASFNRWSDDD